ncbi:MAG: GEGP motif-containing diheme protein [Candidatus Latescibacterota bacterium]
MERTAAGLTAAIVVLCGVAGCGDDSDPAGPGEKVSSRAYKGHANDQDMDHLVAAYPSIAGTRLDDCQSCHTGGQVTTGTRTTFRNACDYCHLVPFPVTGATGGPVRFEGTLNPYGLAYKAAGRSPAALRSLAGQDSDGDGYGNAEEIADSRYPGSPDSRPGQPRAMLRVLDLADLQAMPTHQEFLLANSHKQQFDTYATYRGVRLRDLLEAVGVDLGEVTGITVVAADGFMKSFGVDAVLRQYPDGVFHSGLDTGTRGTECGFVDYPAALPQGLVDGGRIPDPQWLLLAYQRDGGPMDVSYLDPVSGKIEGEGPLRLVVPQDPAGAPDRGSSYSPSGCDDGYDLNDGASHNAGDMVRAVVALRVDPMPAGVEEFDARNGGWAFVDAGQLVVYGQGIE